MTNNPDTLVYLITDEWWWVYFMLLLPLKVYFYQRTIHKLFIQGVLGNEKFLFQFNLIYSGFLYLSLTLGSRASLILSLLDNIRKCNIITLWFHSNPLFFSPTNQHGVFLVSLVSVQLLWFLPLNGVKVLTKRHIVVCFLPPLTIPMFYTYKRPVLCLY